MKLILSAGLLAPFALALPESEQTIAEIAKELNENPNVLWQAGVNSKFAEDDKPSKYAHLMGTLETPEHLKLPMKNIIPRADIPDSFDSREQWPNCPSIQEIRDQGSCGSCWAFGAVEAFSDRACIASNGAITASYSTEDTLSCCKTCGMGCNGGYLGPTWNWFVSSGVCTGDLYEGEGCKPYSIAPCVHHSPDTSRPNCADVPSSKTPACTDTCVSSYSGPAYAADKISASSSYSVGNMRNLDQIQTEIMTNGPVEMSFTVYQDFMSYTGGVYYHVSGRSLGGHAVKLIGWGTDADTGMDYWLIANSWNSDWGESGFFRMRRGTNECGMENSCVAGLVNVD